MTPSQKAEERVWWANTTEQNEIAEQKEANRCVATAEWDAEDVPKMYWSWEEFEREMDELERGQACWGAEQDVGCTVEGSCETPVLER